MTNALRRLGWLVTTLAVVTLLVVPAASHGSPQATQFDMTEMPALDHDHGSMHAHGAHHHMGHSNPLSPDHDTAPHDTHETCNMTSCCPVSSELPTVERPLLATGLEVCRPDIGCQFSQAPPDTSDKPPRHI